MNPELELSHWPPRAPAPSLSSHHRQHANRKTDCLRNRLQKHRALVNGYLHLGASDKAALAASVPTTDQELDVLLEEAWSSASEISRSGFIRRNKREALDYGQKIAEIKHRYKLKMAEIFQREATFVQELLSHDESTPLLLADQLTLPGELNRAITDVQKSRKFDKLRLELKRETALALLTLKARHQKRRQKLHKAGYIPDWPFSALVFCNPQCAHSGDVAGSFRGNDGLYERDSFGQGKPRTRPPVV